MIDVILPPEVSAVEASEDTPEGMLFPEEEVLMARAVDKRRREFATGRACARAALGAPAGPIMPGLRRAPRWPAGFVGSITHCPGYRAAAVARGRDLLAIGVDAEPYERLPEGVLDAIATPDEHSWLADLRTAKPEAHWDRLLFSAKESVYKAWFPLARRWLGFDEPVIAIQPDSGSFTAALLVPGPQVKGQQLTGFTGRWLVRDGLVLTAVTVSA